MFFKKLFFQEFWSIKPVSRPIEIVIKILVWLYVFQSLVDQSKVIFDRSNLFFDQSKIVKRVFFFFFNLCFFTCYVIFNFFKKKKKKVLLSFRSVKGPDQIFCHFPPKFLQGFSPLRPVKPFYPSFCIYFSCFMH